MSLSQSESEVTLSEIDYTLLRQERQMVLEDTYAKDLKQFVFGKLLLSEDIMLSVDAALQVNRKPPMIAALKKIIDLLETLSVEEMMQNT